MTDKKEVKDLTKPENRHVCGIDCGTMTLCKAIQNDKKEVELSHIRNMFLPLDKSQLTMAELSNIDYVESDESIFIIGEDAFNFANLFGQSVKRPMAKGLISSNEIDSIDVLTLIMKQLIGKTTNGYCVYSVPAPSVDIQNNILYHEGVFKRIFGELGYKAESFNEAMAIVYSQCQSSKFSGIGISFGAGMANLCLCWKSVPIISFSVARSGDWIDEQAAMALGTVANRITSIKEKGTDLANFNTGGKKERRIREAIVDYYREVIRNSLEKIKEKLNEVAGNIELPESLPIVIAGGTSMATGFLPLFNEVLNEMKDNFPFQISEVKHASDPLYAVAEGLLVKAMMEDKKVTV